MSRCVSVSRGERNRSSRRATTPSRYHYHQHFVLLLTGSGAIRSSTMATTKAAATIQTATTHHVFERVPAFFASAILLMSILRQNQCYRNVAYIHIILNAIDDKKKRTNNHRFEVICLSAGISKPE